ncbi:TonB-dependent receptor [Sphingopyxis sp. 550A]
MPRHGISGFAMAAAMLGGAAPALAQTTADSASKTTAGNEDIIVTAQRRDESLSRTPVAVDVVGMQELAEQNVRSEADLQFAAPGLSVRAGATSNEVNFSLRGQSVDQFTGTRPGVLPYFNEVQISSNSGGGSGATSFYDLQSVQVLKGPQGTLFGRNATGGAVLFTSAKPTNEFGGYLSARYGNYDTVQLEGALNLPIVDDRLLARVAGFYSDQTGFQHNLYDGSRPGSIERYGVRGSLTWRGEGGFENDLVVDYYKADGTSTQSVLYALDPTQPTAAAVSLFYSPGLDLVFGPGAWDGYLSRHTNPTIPAGGLADFLAIQKARGPFTIATNDANFYRAENLIVTNSTSVDLNDTTKLKNIIGYAHLKTDVRGDTDGSPFGVAGDGEIDEVGRPGGHTRTTILSEELQLLGTLAADRLTYALGFYLSSEKSNVFRQATFLDVFGDLGLSPLSVNSDVAYNNSYAFYGQGTYQLGGGFGVTAGLRYTSETVRGRTLPIDNSYATPAQIDSGVADNDQRKTIRNLSWTFGLQNQISDDVLLYAVTRRSYRNGGFNGSSPPIVGDATVNGNSYGTETVTDVEAGAKFQGLLGTMPARFNIALYNMWIKNGQRNAFADINGPASLAVNVPRTKVYGFELDGDVRLTDWLRIGGNLNYTHARFTNGLTPAFGGTILLGTVPDTPEWSGTVYGEISAPVSSRLTASLRGDLYSQTGTFYIASGNLNPTAHLPGYSIANFRIGIEDEAAGWSLAANLKNAFDKVYYVGGMPLAALLQFNSALPGAPRTYSLEARYRF